MTGRKSRRKPRRPGKRAVKKFKPNYLWLDAYDEAIICSDMALWPEGASITARDLRLKVPMRYGDKLPAALKRMQKKGRLRYSPGSSRFGQAYRLTADTHALVTTEHTRAREGAAA